MEAKKKSPVIFHIYLKILLVSGIGFLSSVHAQNDIYPESNY